MQIKEQEKLLKIAQKAAYSAGLEIMQIYNQLQFDIEYKEDKSPLTKADKAAHSIIMKFLELTNIPIISEEGEIPEYQIRKNWTNCWLVDPLDGTKEFIKRNGEFTVNIALIENGVPIIGIVYIPVKNLMYFSCDNKSYFVENISQDFSLDEFEYSLAEGSKRLPMQKEPDCYRILASRSHINNETKSYIEKLKAENQNIEIINVGSSLKFCMIAAGKANIYPRFSPTMEWDTAAGHAIIIAAGGKVIDMKSGLSLNYNKENLVNPWFIANI
jgi:3'(2'), 5'-bisphosphate nucleotidase